MAMVSRLVVLRLLLSLLEGGLHLARHLSRFGRVWVWTLTLLIKKGNSPHTFGEITLLFVGLVRVQVHTCFKRKAKGKPRPCWWVPLKTTDAFQSSPRCVWMRLGGLCVCEDKSYGFLVDAGWQAQFKLRQTKHQDGKDMRKEIEDGWEKEVREEASPISSCLFHLLPSITSFPISFFLLQSTAFGLVRR